MKVDILKKNDSEIQFTVEGVKPSFASALRRIMVSEVPTMAIELVEFKKNDSALPDEIVSNRLGMAPLTFDRKAYNLPEECKCGGKGCSNCQVKLVLKKKGPAVVYAGDMKSTDKEVKPVYDKIPISELFEGHEMQFEATAQLGTGRKHAKWQAAVVGYDSENAGKSDEGSYTFTVETSSGLKPEEIIIAAGEILEKKMSEFGKQIKKLK